MKQVPLDGAAPKGRDAASSDATGGIVFAGANDVGVGGMSAESLGKLHPGARLCRSSREAEVDVGPTAGPSPDANALGFCTDICMQQTC